MACKVDLSFSADVLKNFYFNAKSLRCVGQLAWNFAQWSVLGRKIFGAKKMQNLAQFFTTLKFGGEYLRNRWRFSKSDKYFVYRDSFCVRWKKSGELWSTNCGDLDVESYPPKAHFSKDHILATRGCCTPKFLHTLENDQVLLAHPRHGWGPLTIFSKGGSKIGFSCSELATITLKPKGVA